jgi:TPR repeat protein
MDGDGYISKADPNVSYTKKEIADAFKTELEKANIPFKTYRADGGKEFVSWDEKYDIEVKQIQQKVMGSLPPKGLFALYRPQKHNERLKDKLKRAKIPFYTGYFNGDEYVAWKTEYKDSVSKIINKEYPKTITGDLQLLEDLGKRNEAFPILKEQADKGSPEAQLRLSEFYMEGAYVERDLDEAVRLIQAAASNNYPPALANLGVNTFNGGLGMQADKKKGINLLRKAALLDDTFAMCVLATLPSNLLSQEEVTEFNNFHEKAKKNGMPCDGYKGILRI